ncbi:hypothetical protein LY622_05930 [Halomonas sp. M5N1S17]|uniref:hypothetical protein n=1 Tax=Halomonas alkalisoli TaxID=2907158 RepID=UPI001F2A40B1|nr:hypothetical protein [Halomonas alkalisoli]MCE9662974.1 hypothetical protein [Halomonas alkalisoli]
MRKELGYPSLGDVVKYVFRASGTMPRKGAHGNNNIFSEEEKKSIQKKLQRLAAEEGELENNLYESFAAASQLLSEVLTCPITASQIEDIINDLYECYYDLIKEKGTLMSKPDTVRYFVTAYGVDVGVRSLTLSWLKWRPHYPCTITPDKEFWYLPAEKHGGVTWPLSHALKWAYDVVGVSQTRFHQPHGIGTDYHLDNNLKCAKSWTSGQAIPSMFVLKKNLDDSFQALSDNGIFVENSKRNNIITVVSLSRISTMIAKDIEHYYGTDFLFDVIAQIKKYVSWIQEEIIEYDHELQKHATFMNKPSKQYHQLRWKILAGFWGHFEAKKTSAQKLINEHMGDDHKVNPGIINWLEKRYGPYSALVPIDSQNRSNADKPERFEDIVEDALKMLNDSASINDSLTIICDEIRLHQIDKHAPWLIPWLQGASCYWSGHYGDAFHYYQEAYTLAKYSAGNYQYRLLNQYLEVAAKTGRWRDFKKAANWASYLNFPIRWLREDEPNDENLRSVYNLLGNPKLKYARL